MDISSILIESKSIEKKSTWLHNSSVEIKEKNGITLIQQAQNIQLGSYCPTIYSPPLQQKCLFKMTINSIYQRDRYLPFGIIDQKVFDASKKDCVLKAEGIIIHYAGYKSWGNLTGIKPLVSKDDPKGLCPGKEVFLEYVPQKSVRFYDKENTIDLQRSLEGETGEFYLFVVPYTRSNSCTIEKLE